MQAGQPKCDYTDRLVEKERYKGKNKEFHRTLSDDCRRGSASPFNPLGMRCLIIDPAHHSFG